MTHISEIPATVNKVKSTAATIKLSLDCILAVMNLVIIWQLALNIYYIEWHMHMFV